MLPSPGKANKSRKWWQKILTCAENKAETQKQAADSDFLTSGLLRESEEIWSQNHHVLLPSLFDFHAGRVSVQGA